MLDFKEEDAAATKQGQDVSPGERLRIAREKSGLSRKDVASHLKLSTEKIDSLEHGKVDHLAAPVFVAGYLRAYAKLVGLPEDEIIEEFKALAEMEAPSVDPSTSPASNNYGQMNSFSMRRGTGKTEKDWSKQAIWGSAAVLIAVILFVVFPEENSTPVKMADKKSVESGDNKFIEDRKIINEVNEVNEVNEINRINETETGIAEEEKTTTPKTLEQQKTVITHEQSMIDTSRSLDENNLEHSVVVFNFKEDSWIEVNDALNKRLLYRLGKAGTSRTVWGIAPFNVQLGYVDGVSIIFNGKPYDLSRFSNRKSVKFRLGKSTDVVN